MKTRSPPQRLGVLLQLLHEPKVRFGSPPPRLYKLHRLRGRPPKLGDQVRGDDARGPADALDAVDEHARVRVGQCAAQKGGRVWEVGGELGEREVVEGVLGAVDGGGEGDVAAHGGEDVGDAEACECGWVFGKGEVGDVEMGHDLGGAWWAEGVGRLGDGGRGPLALALGGGGGGGDGHGWSGWRVTSGETQTGSLWRCYIVPRASQAFRFAHHVSFFSCDRRSGRDDVDDYTARYKGWVECENLRTTALATAIG